MIVKTDCDSDRSFYSTIRGRGGPPQRGRGRGGGGRQPGARPRGLHRRQGRAVIEWRFSINSCYIIATISRFGYLQNRKNIYWMEGFRNWSQKWRHTSFL